MDVGNVGKNRVLLCMIQCEGWQSFKKGWIGIGGCIDCSDHVKHSKCAESVGYSNYRQGPWQSSLFQKIISPLHGWDTQILDV